MSRGMAFEIQTKITLCVFTMLNSVIQSQEAEDEPSEEQERT
jgi:hypothetical protein